MLKIYRFLKPYAFHLLGIAAATFLQAMTDLLLPTVMADIVNNGILNADTAYIRERGGVMLLIAGAGALCAAGASLLGAKTSAGLGRVLRSRLFRRAEYLSLRDFDRFGASTLLTRTTNDIFQIQNVTVLIFTMMVRAPLTLIGGILLALTKDRRLTLLLIAALPFLALTVALTARFVIPLFRRIQQKIDRVNRILRENLTGIRVIRAFNREKFEQERFAGANRSLTGTYIRVNRILALLTPGMMLIMDLTTAAVLWFGALRIDRGEMDLGALVAFLQYAMQILSALILMTVMFVLIPRAQASAGRILDVLNTKPESDVPAAQAAGPAAESGRGRVEFRNVTFRYEGAEKPALQNISFTVNPGEIVAVIGGTGSGKTTLANLILRFYDAESGTILVDGVDVRNMTRKHLRKKIGLVPQKALLFSGTVRDNLRYGKQDADDAEMERAAETAQAADFIRELEGGFGARLSTGGLSLSGGQRQRLAIARALIRKPEIAVLDDSFSALDFQTDAKLRAALRKDTEGSTLIWIAQRVSSILDADRILVLDDGKLAGVGTHRSLLETCSVYREIAASQLTGEEPA